MYLGIEGKDTETLRIRGIAIYERVKTAQNNSFEPTTTP